MARVITGVVSSDQADKTIVVTTHERRRHRLYDKQYTVTSKYHAHDQDNTAKLGDTVEIGEARPVSKLKRWQLKRVVEKAPKV